MTTALVMFAAAAASDAADGYLAKRFGWQSNLGAILDPIADKLLLATVLIVLGFLGLVPLWLVAAAVARDAVIVAGAVSYRIFIGPLEARPSRISKLNTLCQAAFILAVVGKVETGLPPAWLQVLLGALVFATVVVSGIDYVLVYGRQALQAARLGRGLQ